MIYKKDYIFQLLERLKKSLLNKRFEWIYPLVLGIIFLFQGVQYYQSFFSKGHWYQEYFEPAVLIGCGHGFRLTQNKKNKEKIQSFLKSRDRVSFDCSALEKPLKLDSNPKYQDPWIYLMYSVGLSWKIFGVSWLGLTPLFGFLFLFYGLSVYLIFSLFFNAPYSFLFSLFYVQPYFLEHLRDFSKAPFTLFSLFLLLKLFFFSSKRSELRLLISLLYGVIIGLGYGFRQDFLINVPVFLFVTFLFLNVSFWKKFFLNALMLVGFFLLAYPAISYVGDSGGCHWHVALLGLTSPFLSELSFSQSFYRFGPIYNDSWVDDLVHWVGFVQNGVNNIGFCSAEYDYWSGLYYRNLFHFFPADFYWRAIRSFWRIIIENNVFNSIFLFLYTFIVSFIWCWKKKKFSKESLWFLVLIIFGLFLKPHGLLFFGFSLYFALKVFSPKKVLFLSTIILYFTGYPSIQFNFRHYFHLEVFSYLILSFFLWYFFEFLFSDKIISQSLTRRAKKIVLIYGSVFFIFSTLVFSVQNHNLNQIIHRFDLMSKKPVEFKIENLSIGKSRLNLNLTEGTPYYLKIKLKDTKECVKRKFSIEPIYYSVSNDVLRSEKFELESFVSGTEIYFPYFRRSKRELYFFGDFKCLESLYSYNELKKIQFPIYYILPKEKSYFRFFRGAF
ncbi:MAG: hypothetical protein CL678_02960 [Bdellovibrionaceae bacterium]|nr:hypothetical protein [Pseudobdellovibrionaceae bacterium]|tara:strand:- start:2920 stop:4923 length:2004 start_codon:yes stop_codon:yes gene_type:complete